MRVTIDNAILTDIADSIREKGAASGLIAPQQMAEAISRISGGGGGGEVYGIDAGEFTPAQDTMLAGYTFNHKLNEVPVVILVYADDYNKIPNNADTKMEFAAEVPGCPLFSIRAKRYSNNQYNGYNDNTPFVKTSSTVSFNSDLTGYILSAGVTYKWVVMSSMCNLIPSEWNVAHGSFIGDGSVKITIPNPRSVAPITAALISEPSTVGYCQRYISLYKYDDGATSGVQIINNSAGSAGAISASNMSADNAITDTEIVFASRGGNYTFKENVKYDWYLTY